MSSINLQVFAIEHLYKVAPKMFILLQIRINQCPIKSTHVLPEFIILFKSHILGYEGI